MSHTFLFEERHWNATGRYWDENEKEFEVEGAVTVVHGDDHWENKGYMRLIDSGVTFENVYEIEPVDAGAKSTSWVSSNPALGKLFGRFEIIADSIVSLYRSEDGQYTGSEYFVKIADNRYKVLGILFKGEHKVSSWSVALASQ